jgi:hypothetical protein
MAGNPFDASSRDEQPMRFGLGMSASLASPVSPNESKVEESASTPPTKPESRPHVAKARQNQPQPKLAMKSPEPVRPPSSSFRVVGVAMDDALIIRNGPSEYHAPVGFISPSGKGVEIVGTCLDVWCPVRHHRTMGWVNRHYLADENVPPESEGQ